MGGWNVVSAVLERGADPVAALAHRGVGQTHRVEVVLIALATGAIDFDLDDVGIDSVDSGAESFIEHCWGLERGVGFPRGTRLHRPSGDSKQGCLIPAVMDITRELWK